MGEFDDFTKKLGEEHARKSEEHRAQEERNEKEREVRYDAGQYAIEQQVMPLLAEAEAACERQGLRVETTVNWQNGRYSTPSVEFQAFGQKSRPYDSSTYEVHGHKIAISHDGDDFHARIARSSLNAKEKSFSGQGIGAVKASIKIAIASIFEELSPDAG